jgi:hypothetical protein
LFYGRRPYNKPLRDLSDSFESYRMSYNLPLYHQIVA